MMGKAMKTPQPLPSVDDESQQPVSPSRAQRRLADALAVLDLLAQMFPKAFFVYAPRRHPLKVGIFNDIIVRLGDALTTRELHFALRHYVRNALYLKRMKAGTARIDLDGNPAGVVTAEQAQQAAADLVLRQK
jgi:ProP effector